jgi:hypothetical protein
MAQRDTSKLLKTTETIYVVMGIPYISYIYNILEYERQKYLPMIGRRVIIFITLSSF